MARRAIPQDFVVDVVDALPDLQDLLPADRLPETRRVLRARAALVRRGRWEAEADAGLVSGGAGLLVVDGALVRCVRAAHRTSAELLGPGDLLRPDHDFEQEEPFSGYWRAISDVRLALLDARFTRVAAQVPEVVPALMASVGRRTGAASRQLVIVQAQAVEDRILATLAYLAERWGVMTADGIVLPGFLSQGTLALLLGARRPSVTSAMVRLIDRGAVIRHGDGRWLLPAQRSVPSARAATAAASVAA